MHATAPPTELRYRTRVAAQALRPGAHGSRVRGAGLALDRVVPWHQDPQARRLDLRATLADPLQGWWVRQYHQRSALNVWLVADRSASMATWDATVQALALALVPAVLRMGDQFGLMAWADATAPLQRWPATRSRSAALQAVAEGLGVPARGASATGLAALPAQLPRQPALVLLVSDFLMPVPLLDEALAGLARHDVVPVWLAGGTAEPAWPRWGLLTLRDAETGQARLLALRPALRQRLQSAQQDHREAVRHCLARHGRRPLALGAWDAQAFNHYFASREGR
jgi:uncharacterized protein (DUF58 family)